MKRNRTTKVSVCCTKVAKYICEHLDEKFDSPRCKHIRKHLENCQQCSQVLKELKSMITLY
ncbi:MAG: hypothetical protein N3A63_04065, partial [Bacteroidetes bacterium]|nr:hypothetical protein [Bacteroidota bacterium]